MTHLNQNFELKFLIKIFNRMYGELVFGPVSSNIDLDTMYILENLRALNV